MPRWLKLSLIAVVALAALAAIGLAILVQTIDLDHYTRLAVAEVKSATGRDLRIAGKLDVKVFPRLAITAENVSFANAPWGSRPDMVRVKRLEAALALMPLLHREIDITRLVLVEPDVLLETDTKGVGNWVLKPAGASPPSTPGSSSSGFDFDVSELAIDTGRLTWRTAGSKEPLLLGVKRLRLSRHALAAVLDVDLEASLHDQPFTLKGSMGTIARILANDGAWPVDLTFATAGAQVSVGGKVDWSGKLPAIDAAVKGEVKDAAGLAKLAGSAIAVPVPLSLTAKLAATRGEQRIDPITLTVGKTSAEGSVVVRTSEARPFVTAKLRSRELDLSSGAKPAPTRGGRLFSDTPFPLEGLRAVDADADIAIDRLVLPSRLPLDGVNAHVALKGGRLAVQPFAAGLGGGSLNGVVTLDASQPKTPSLAIRLDGKNISLERVLAALGRGNLTGGNTDLAINLTGPGESMRRFMGGANGELRVVVGPARTSGLVFDAGGDALTRVLDAANPGRRSDPYTELKCAVIRLPVRDGIATSQRTIASETAKLNLVAAGTINLRTEGLDLAIRPTVKEGLGIGAASLAELVKVTGTLSDPSVGIDTLGSARAALSVGGALMTGGLSLLGERLLSKSTSDPNPCRTALAGGVEAPAPRTAATQPKEDEGLLGSVRRLFK